MDHFDSLVGNGARKMFLIERCQPSFQVVEGELFRERAQDVRRDVVVCAKFLELGSEQVLVVQGGLAVSRNGVAADGFKREVAPLVDHAGAKPDRRNVALANCPHAHDEALLAGGQTALVRSGHHRRVEEGRRFNRVLVGEVCPDQQTSLLGEPDILLEMMLDHLKVVLQHLREVTVAVREVLEHVVQNAGSLPIRDRQDPLHHHLHS